MSKLIADIVVLGCGAVGSATLYELARNKVKVIGIEQYGVAHDKGSSHGETRAMRQGYYDNPRYIPILKKAYQKWLSFEKEAADKFFEEVGVIKIGVENSIELNNTVTIAKDNGIDIEIIDSDEINYRYQGLHADVDTVGILEKNGGYLYVEKIIRTQIELAIKHGATILTEEKVLRWHQQGSSVIIETTQHAIHAKKLIICSGGWTNQILHGLQLPLTLLQKGLYWFKGKDIHNPENMPVFSFEKPEGLFYGFPNVNGNIKVAKHSGGTKINLPEEAGYDQEEYEQVFNFVQQSINNIDLKIVKRGVCFYTSTPTGNFIIDFLPDNSNVLFAAGLSGHGFKMSNMLGHYLASMAMTGSTAEEIKFLSLKNALTL